MQIKEAYLLFSNGRKVRLDTLKGKEVENGFEEEYLYKLEGTFGSQYDGSVRNWELKIEYK